METKREIVYCPRCGSYRLKAHSDHQKIALKNPIKEEINMFRKLLQEGFGKCLRDSIEETMNMVRYEHRWECQNCGCLFKM